MQKFKITYTKDGNTKHWEYGKDEIFQHVTDEIANSIKSGDRRHMLMKAGTGVGKSTEFMYQLHKRLNGYQIICTQPTVFNALMLSQFLGRRPDLTLGVNLGISTGQQKVEVTAMSSIVYATIGSILNKVLFPMMEDPTVDQGDLVIVMDEAHGNSFDQQLSLSIAQYLIKNMKKPPIFIIQSASISIPQFAQFFDSKIVYEIEGQRQPIIEFYVDDMMPNKRDSQDIDFGDFVYAVVNSIIERKDPKILKAIQEANCNPAGDILIFVTGKKMVELAEQALDGKLPHVVKMLTLSRDSLQLRPSLRDEINYDGQKVIISTNIAETGITFEKISYAIDCVKFKSIFYDPLRKCSVIRDLPICKNMMQQRRGRVGRITGGIYFGAIHRNNVPKLMDYREKELQIQDMKPAFCQLGVDIFRKLQFMFRIPDEIYLDALQGMAFGGYFNNVDGRLYQIIMKDLPKQDPQYKMLLYCGMIMGISPAELIALIVLIQGHERAPKPRISKGKDDFIKVIQKINTGNILKYQSSAYSLYLELASHLTENSISIFGGKSATILRQEFKQVITRAFQQYIMRKVKQDNRFVTYITDYGVQIRIQHDPRHPSPDMLVTNSFTDNGFIQPGFLLDCSDVANYRSKCSNGMLP